jgi:hypothetical protein
MGEDTETGSLAPLGQKTYAHVVDSLMYAVQLTLGYFLMLIAMVYNAGLFAAVVIGAMLGYIAFAKPRKGMREEEAGSCCD